MELEKEYHFNGGIIVPLAEDVILIKYETDHPIEVEHIIASRDKRIELIGDRPYFPVIDCTNGFTRFSPEAKKWVSENIDSSKIRILDILWVNNFAMKIEAKLYLRLYKPINTTKIVMSIPEAMEVIRDYKSKSAAC